MKRLMILAALAGALFMAGAIPAAAETAELTVGMPADAKAIDPHQAVDNYSFAVLKHINQPLATMDGKTKELVPILAEKWEILDEKTYKFYLKKGVKFHNGDELTAEDVVFSFRRMMTDPKSFYTKSKGNFIDPDGFEIIDKHTVIIKTMASMPIFLSGMRHPYANILSKRAVEEAGDEYFRNPVGTGPYKFKDWVKGEKVELERFDDYYGKKGNFKNITFLVIPDASSRVIALETGKVDLIYEVPGNDVERLNASDKTKVVESEGLILHHLLLNTRKKPMDDPRVRKAIEFALNKEAYGHVVYQGLFTTPVGPILPVSSYFPADAKPYPCDPARARELLKEAGLPDGFEMELWIANFADRVSGATVIQSMLAEVGIKINITVYESGVFDGLGKDPGYDMAIRTVGMQTARDAGDYWHVLFHSTGIGGYNWSQLDDPELDRLLDEANAEMDPVKRDERLQAIWERVDELHPDVALSIPSELYGARKDLMGLEELGDGRQNYLGDLTIKE
ncbi:MAG: ABC transporter substrate-binding protein [Aminivibrio sp.]